MMSGRNSFARNLSARFRSQHEHPAVEQILSDHLLHRCRHTVMPFAEADRPRRDMDLQMLARSYSCPCQPDHPRQMSVVDVGLHPDHNVSHNDLDTTS